MPKNKKVVIDTSVWIAYFKGSSASIRSRFDDLLDTGNILLVSPVKMELLSGVKQQEIFRLERIFQAVDPFIPDSATWEYVEECIKKSSRKGIRFGIMDLLIAASAHQNTCLLWSLDKDFLKMEKLELVHLYS